MRRWEEDARHAMSRRLLDHGVCATAMTGWGAAHGTQYIRFVFANEPV
jgi:aspartate/methionine/tyrosine aminotransferase